MSKARLVLKQLISWIGFTKSTVCEIAIVEPNNWQGRQGLAWASNFVGVELLKRRLGPGSRHRIFAASRDASDSPPQAPTVTTTSLFVSHFGTAPPVYVTFVDCHCRQTDVKALKVNVVLLHHEANRDLEFVCLGRVSKRAPSSVSVRLVSTNEHHNVLLGVEPAI